MARNDSESGRSSGPFCHPFNDLDERGIPKSWKQVPVTSCNPGASPKRRAKTPQSLETYVPNTSADGAGACTPAEAPAIQPARDRFEWDPELPGFGIRTLKSGRRVYIIQYRERGHTRRRTLCPVEGADRRKVRREAKRRLTTVAVNHKVVDPFAAAAVADKLTLAAFVPRFWELRKPNWKERTQQTNWQALEREILPALGHIAVEALTRAHVVAWRDGMSSRPGTANRALPVLSGLMKTAEHCELRRRQSNPCRNMARLKTKRRLRFLSMMEVEQLGAALARHEADEPVACDIIRLLLLTGARKSEIGGLRWAHVDGGFLHLADSKTGPSTRYVGARGRAILERRRQLSPNAPASAFVFDSEHTGKQPRLDYASWKAIRETAGITDVRLHDLRHTFASHAVMNAVSLSTVSRLLGHALLESTEIYAHLSEASVREAAHRVSSRIGQLAGISLQEAA